MPFKVSSPFTVTHFSTHRTFQGRTDRDQTKLGGVAKNRLSTFFSNTHADFHLPPSTAPHVARLSPRGPRETSLQPPERTHLITPFSADSAPPPAPCSCLPPLGDPYGTLSPSSDPHATPESLAFPPSTFPYSSPYLPHLPKSGERRSGAAGLHGPGAVSAYLPVPRRVRPGKSHGGGTGRRLNTTVLSGQDEITEPTHLHEEQHIFPRLAQSFSPLLLQLAYRPKPQR